MKMRSYNFFHTNTKNPGNNLGIFCLITGRPKLNGYRVACKRDAEDSPWPLTLIKALPLSSGNFILSSKEGFYSNNGLIIFAIFSSPSLSMSLNALYLLLSFVFSTIKLVKIRQLTSL